MAFDVSSVVVFAIRFLLHSFFSYGYVLTCSDWNDFISVCSLCVSVFNPLSLKLVSLE